MDIRMTYTYSKTEPEKVQPLKQKYLGQLSAPLDGMWESFATQADHYAILQGDTTIGYGVINPGQQLLQFFVLDGHDDCRIFEGMLGNLKIIGAFVATCDVRSLSLCMDHQKSISVNALMYHANSSPVPNDATFPPHSNLQMVETSELGSATSFAVETLGQDPGWLESYFSERIARKELFGLWQAESLIATGECRLSDSQPPYADLGMIVARDFRGQGIATAILQRLRKRCHDHGLRAICSTDSTNLAARKAIERAGFVSHHRILEVRFNGGQERRNSDKSGVSQ